MLCAFVRLLAPRFYYYYFLNGPHIRHNSAEDFDDYDELTCNEWLGLKERNENWSVLDMVTNSFGRSQQTMVETVKMLRQGNKISAANGRDAQIHTQSHFR